jgi:hypothetical protein
VNLGTENKKQAIIAAVLAALLVFVVVYEFWPSSSTIASTATTTSDFDTPASTLRQPAHKNTAASGKKPRTPQNLDPMLHLDQLAAAEQIKYEGSGRNIFISQADVQIPTPQGPGVTDHTKNQVADIYHPPAQAAAPPIPLKFFGFANQPGEPKKIFLSKGDDVFIAGEGEIIDRRYKVVKISASSVDIQDVVLSGPAQTIPLTQANPS